MIVLDFETRSKVNLKTQGSYRYIEDESFEPLCIASKILGNEFSEISLAVPKQDCRWMFDPSPNETFIAHNANFERNILRKYLKPSENKYNYICTAALCAYFGLPRSLKEVGKVLELKNQKDAHGDRILSKVCIYKPIQGISNKKEDLEELYDYCKQDVATEIELYTFLSNFSYPDFEKRIYELDQKINDKGIKIDISAVKKVIPALEVFSNGQILKLKDLTNGEITSPNQSIKLLNYLKNTKKVDIENLTASSIENNLDIIKDENIKEILLTRKRSSKTSTAKYKSLLNAACKDERLRGTLLYYGAHTGRWAGRIFQPQNLPRGFDLDVDLFLKDLDYFSKLPDFMNYASSAIRGMITASSKHHILHCVDFSGIELRVLLWLVGDGRGLDLLKKKVDIYKDMASRIYTKPYDEITKLERQLGKTAILGLGYGMGAAKFIKSCAASKIEIDQLLSEKVVYNYREAYKSVVRFWYHLERCIKEAIKNPNKNILINDKIGCSYRHPFLSIILPSRRAINFYKPHLSEIGEIRYYGVDSFSKKFMVLGAYGGSLTNNIVQALSRDLMADRMLELDAKGYNIVLTVHDEIICDENVTDNQHSLEQMVSIMKTNPNWAPDLPIEVEGFSSYRYRK